MDHQPSLKSTKAGNPTRISGLPTGRSPSVKALLLLLCFSSTLLGVSKAQSIDPKLTRCSGGQWFDTAAFTCRDCRTNEEPDAAGRGCTCKPGFVRKKRTERGDSACTRCGPGETPNRDATQCLPCAATGMELKVGGKDGQCKCTNEQDIFIEDTKLEGGKWVLQAGCRTCPPGGSGPGWECRKCPHPAMEWKKVGPAYECKCKDGYPAAGDGCVKQADLDAVYEALPRGGRDSITYRALQLGNGEPDPKKGQPQQSGVVRHYLAEAAVGCWKDRVPRFCQVLANLCVLTLYDQRSSSCRFLQDYLGEGKAGSGTWANKLKEGLPWIRYTGTDDATGTGTATSLLSKTLASQGYDFVPATPDAATAGISRSLKFQLAQYALNGTWLGYTELGSQLSICPLSYRDVLNLKRLGMQMEATCTFPIADLKKRQAELGRRRDANVFFELYLEDSDGKLANVPVLVRNYRSEDEKFPNQGSDKAKWIFSRRFLIYDTVSGIRPGGFADGDGLPQVVRWASDIKLKVTMDPEQQASGERLLRPYLIIDYRERDVSTISSSESVQASLQVDYFTDYSSALSATTTGFIILFIAALLYAALRIYYFYQRNPTAALGRNERAGMHHLMSCYYVLDSWSAFMALLLWVATLAITWTYKGQEAAAILLPELGEASDTLYRAFYGVFGATLAARAAANLIRVFQQARAEVYMVDLERPRPGATEVNAWRTIFLANEWAELQCEQRVVEPETAFIWFAFFWVGLGWREHCGADPDSTNEADALVKKNILLKFFWVTLVFYGVGAGRVLAAIARGWATRSDYLGQLIDLATLANVSLVVLDEPLHGYYVHGQAPWGRADIPLDLMQKKLQEEEGGALGPRPRGLKHNDLKDKDDRVQSFEIYLPAELRASLAAARTEPPPASELAGGKASGAGADLAAPKAPDDDKKKAAGAKAKRNKEQAIREEEYRRTRISAILSKELGDGLAAEQIKASDWKTRWAGAPPEGVDISTLRAPLVVQDLGEGSPSFMRTLYRDLDRAMLDLYIMLFIAFDEWLGDNSLLALFLVWCIERVYREIRARVGVRNLSKKAYVDGRFLG